MFHIKSVDIDGFWGKHFIKSDFFPDVNIFIGKNGTGKTTFMNLLQAVLQVDLVMLMSLEFSSITIKLGTKDKVRTIKVEREDNSEVPFEVFIFKIATKNYRFQILESDLNPRRMITRRPRFAEQYEALKEEIDSLVRVASLSVHRAVYAVSEGDEFARRQLPPKSAIDQRLEELMQQLTRYQLALELQARKVSSDFEKDVLVSMLYDQQFDKWDLKDISNVELSKEKTDLSKAYQELRILDDNVAKKIDTHIKALSASLKRLNNPESKGIRIEDIFPLSLLRRTQHIVNLTKTTEEKKQIIFQPIKKYVDIILSFITDKQFKFGSNGELQIFRDNKQVSISQLSSGEKQLLILLTETLLQKNESFIFLADEPELSLHIEWQAQIISSIKQLNQNAQVIAATHSPEIAGGWNDNIIDMEDILNG